MIKQQEIVFDETSLGLYQARGHIRVRDRSLLVMRPRKCSSSRPITMSIANAMLSNASFSV